ncbi:hypothetical protein IWW50_004032 [Coemansia erecta]|nr:hypothetical protein GGF43_005061 [Coemansia sp. RSA 2618]KAJ2822865.1 hypothetical protein IWW50_004032 [Coemansia erecta]
MKLSTVLLSAAAVGLSAFGGADAQQNQPACSTVYTRKEILSLTASEWNLYKAIMTAMQRDGWFQWFAYLHTQWFPQIHGHSQFFPFHRRFVYEWERVGKQYNSAFAQPYWDEMRDYRTPATSQVLTSNWVGGNGQGSGSCVQNGLQAGWTMTYPNSHCFTRNFRNNGNLGSWYSPEYISSFVQTSANMAAFRPGIEFSLHGIVHLDIGGDMAQRASPNDWIFMLHHANLDRLWWQWQNNGHMWTMDGPNADGSAISINSGISYFNEPIRNVMQLGYGNMCFQYASNPIRRRDLDATAESRLISKLPQDILSKWFPEMAKHAGAVSAVSASPAIAQAAAGKSIPYPGTLTDEWIHMHNYKVADVRKVEATAREFVNDMKKAGYTSN